MNVIRLEHPVYGDPSRMIGHTILSGERMNAYFLCINAGEKTLTLDLSRSEGQDPLPLAQARNPASMAKYFTVESACSATDSAARIFGGYGYSMEYNVQRYYRDNRFFLYGGTQEVLQTTIARKIMAENR